MEAYGQASPVCVIDGVIHNGCMRLTVAHDLGWEWLTVTDDVTASFGPADLPGGVPWRWPPAPDESSGPRRSPATVT